MSFIGIGWVFDKDNPVSQVKYDLYINRENHTIAGFLNVLEINASLWGHNSLTLHLDNNRKLNFLVSEANGSSYHIVGNGVFYH